MLSERDLSGRSLVEFLKKKVSNILFPSGDYHVRMMSKSASNSRVLVEYSLFINTLLPTFSLLHLKLNIFAAARLFFEPSKLCGNFYKKILFNSYTIILGYMVN